MPLALRSWTEVHHWNKMTITPNSFVHKKVFLRLWIFTQAPFTKGTFNTAEKPLCMTVSHPSPFPLFCVLPLHYPLFPSLSKGPQTQPYGDFKCVQQGQSVLALRFISHPTGLRPVTAALASVGSSHPERVQVSRDACRRNTHTHKLMHTQKHN